MNYHAAMPLNLKRYQGEGDDHFVTFSCYHREPYLCTLQTRDLVEDALEAARVRYSFQVLGYVIMPEHVHLLVSEPEYKSLAAVLGALKVSVSKRSSERPFWQTRYYDFNVFTHDKRVEKIKYMHRNPVVRSLVRRAEDWPHSSYCHYLRNKSGRVTITSPY